MKAFNKIKRIILCAVALLILTECVASAVYTTDQATPPSGTSIQASDQSSILSIFLINKSEQEEKKEGENEKASLVELADFSKLADLLSSACTKRFDFAIVEHQHVAPHPPLFKVFCVFII